MSFGFSVGDFLAVLKIAKKVYNACKDGPREYQEISRETKSLYVVLDSLKDEAENPESLLNRTGTSRRKELLQIVSNCEEAFNQLQVLVDKHSRLATDGHRRIWDSYQIGAANFDNMRGKLTLYLSMMNLFLDSLGVSAMGRIEAKLDKLFAKVIEADTNNGPRSDSVSIASIISVVSIADPDQEDDVWDLIRKELVDEKIDVGLLEAHKLDIVAYLKGLVEKADVDNLEPACSPHYLPKTGESQKQNSVASVTEDDTTTLTNTNRPRTDSSAPIPDNHPFDDPVRLARNLPAISVPLDGDIQMFEAVRIQNGGTVRIDYAGYAQQGSYRGQMVCFIGIKAIVNNTTPKTFATLVIGFDPGATVLSRWDWDWNRNQNLLMPEQRQTDAPPCEIWHKSGWGEKDILPESFVAIKTTLRQVYEKTPLISGFLIAYTPSTPLTLRLMTEFIFKSSASKRLPRLMSWIGSIREPLRISIHPPMSELVIEESPETSLE
jgi:hypothetical protein